MKFDPKIHHRRSIRLPGYDYTREGAYYITVVTWQREELFGEVVDGEMVLNKFGQVAQTEWERLPRRFWHIELSEFVIMPNHAHGIILIVDGRGTADVAYNNVSELPRRAPATEQFGKPVAGSIPTIVRSYKSAVSLRINLMRRTNGVPVWQRNYYEHIIRNDKDYQTKCDYILNNPHNWESDDNNEKNGKSKNGATHG
ncbi:MAG: transposase [Anaerolineales bacterium]